MDLQATNQEERDSIASEYFESLRFDPYPVQEEALLAWYTSPQGVLVCAPTGSGKTLIAEAALFEALKTGKKAYYTTPLIALTDQKLQELRETVVRWGFKESDVGLVTGNRKVNADAPILVVVAEILLNRLLQTEQFDFDEVSAVVMDEFHSFNDRERGIVWELTLGMLPAHVRTLLLSATVGNSYEFTSWLGRSLDRKLKLVESHDRKVPLSFQWVDDHMLDEWVEKMVQGDEAERRTPALIFCFNREACWQVGELLKGKKVVDKLQQAALVKELEQYDWSQGVGPKLKQLLTRGVGVHHAGVLPKYRRVVEELFQKKLLSVTVCTETLSAGINLPARSVVLPTILKGPKSKRKVVETSTAQQIF
ncbi:MAG: DEAD/DEAH box helicase, partial [Planctomycetota bacterium]